MVIFRSISAVLFVVIYLLLGLPDQGHAIDIKAGCSTRCHRSKVLQAFVHTPVRSDDCVSCHSPTGKDHPKVSGGFTLIGKGAQLCYSCHESKSDKKFVHGPVAAGDCLACHDVHQSPYPKQLKGAGAELCFMCHGDSFKSMKGHPPVEAGSCTDCHDPHQSDNRMMLKKSGAALCFMCHDQKLADGKVVHEPVAAGDCTSCHAPHGSRYQKLLKSAFPAQFYLPYNVDNYALCFGCHNRELAKDKRTDTLTGFRNGDRNLHYLHVNRPDKGRSCKTCHQPHAGNQDKLIKEKVHGFGSWDIPIGFTRVDTGGTCVVGCHKPKTYDRIRPVNYQ